MRPEESTSSCPLVADGEAQIDSSGRIAPLGMTISLFLDGFSVCVGLMVSVVFPANASIRHRIIPCSRLDTVENRF